MERAPGPLALHAVGKASSSKKVQRAAKAAASSRGASESRELGFPLVVAVVVVLGILLVVVARSSRDELASPRVGEDHWHAAYSIYNCDSEVAYYQSTSDPDGIHSHQDSLIHIHPFNSGSSGEDAVMQVFLEAMRGTITQDEITGPEFPDIRTEDGCGDEQAVIKVARWQVDPELELVAVYDRDFESIAFLEDREAFSIAMVPVGEDPPPPSATSLAQLDASTGSDLISTGTVPLDVTDDSGTDDSGTSDSDSEDSGDGE